MLFIRRKQIVLSLLLAILLSLTGNISFQAEGKEEPLSQYYGPRDGIEIEELRTETSKQYLLPDGTMQYIGSPDRIHWKDENGQYIDIDNTIIETAYNVNGLLYSHKNKSSDFSLFFANSSMENEFPIRIEYQEYAFSYGIEGSQFNYVFGEETSFPEILLENVCLENAVMYQGDEGYDLVYIPKNIGEKEYIIIYGPMETSSFVFQLRLEGLIPVQMEREVVLINEDGNPVFEMGDLFAMDSNNIYCDDVQAELLGFYEETATISINVNQNWMNDDNRVYPILIDPTYTICGEFVTADSYVSSVDANVNFYLSDYLRMGKDDDYGIRRTYIRFDNLPSILSTNLTSACINIRLYSSSGSLSTIRASTITSSWDSDSITWNNTPSISNMYLSGYLAPDTWHDTTNWYTLDVTTIVGRWLGGLQTNYGVKISDDVENSTSHWSTFYSSDSGYPNRPELMINYTSSTSYSWNAVQVGPNDGSLDHSSFMDPIKTYLQGRGYTVSNQKGKFTPANINSFLSGGTYSIFIVKAHCVSLSNGYCRMRINAVDTPNIWYHSSNIVNMSSGALDGCQIAVFMCCEGGKDYSYRHNFPTASVDKGAKCSIGFTTTISSSVSSEWVKRMFYALSTGYTVQGAVNYANNNTPNYSGSGLNSIIIEGNPYATIN